MKTSQLDVIAAELHEPQTSRGRPALQIDHRLRLFGAVGSLALHGVVASLIVWRLSAAVGASAPVHAQTVVMNVHVVVPAAPPKEAFTTPPPRATEPSPTQAQDAPAPASRVEPALTRTSPTSGGAPAGMADSGPAAPQAEGQARTDYEAVLLAHLRSYFFYPNQARERRLGGTVEVRLELARNGQVLGAWVQTSTGESVLDAAALELVHRAQPMPAIPSTLPDHMDVYLPLEYLPPKIMIGAG